MTRPVAPGSAAARVRPLLPSALIVLAGLIARPGPLPAADEPATRPAPDGAPAVDNAVARSFADLADSDAAVREAARADLLAMDRRQLPSFQALVRRARPLLPSQAAVLRGIVTHVYLAGDPYDADRDFGFLGVRMQPTAVNLQHFERPHADLDDPAPNPGELPPGGFADGEPFPMPPMGVVIVERLPGFVGARLLRDGDVILAFADRPDIPFGTGSAFTEAVRNTRPGRPVHLILLRQGRLVKVSIPLDPRPRAAEQMNPAAMDALDRRRREKAEAYWREAFAPLVREGVG